MTTEMFIRDASGEKIQCSKCKDMVKKAVFFLPCYFLCEKCNLELYEILEEITIKWITDGENETKSGNISS